MALHTEETIGAYFERMVAADPDHDFVVYPDRALRWSYREFKERVDRLAKGLLAIGIERGDNVGIWARNVPDWLTFMFATAKIGAVLVTVNPVYKSHELAYVMKQSDMKALCIIDAFRDVDYVQIVRELVPEALTQERGRLVSGEFPMLKSLIYMGPEKHRGMYTVPELLLLGEHGDDAAYALAQTGFDAGDVINMQYTSGTTGFPKGVMLTHRNILNNGFFIGERQDLTAADRVCIPVPLFHCFGCVLGVLATLTHGATLVMLESFDPLLVLAAVQKERATALYGVPTMFIAELAHPMFSMFDLTSLRTGIMAGSPCPIETMRQVIDRMHAREMTICYGLTEASPVYMQTSTDDTLERKCETVGTQASGGRGPRHRPADGRGLPAERPRRVLLPRLQHHEGLLQHAGGHRGGDRRRRLAALRRRRHSGRGRLLPHHRPHQGHDHPRRREHLPARDRGVPLHHAGHRGRPGRGRAGCEVRRGRRRVHPARGGGRHHRVRRAGVRARAAGALQGAQVRLLRRRFPAHGLRQGPEVQAARLGQGTAGRPLGRLRRRDRRRGPRRDAREPETASQ